MGSRNTKPHLDNKIRIRSCGLVWTEQQLREAVEDSFSTSEVIDRLGIAKTNISHRTIKRKIHALGLDTSHFKPQARHGPSGSKSNGFKSRTPRELILCENSNHGGLRELVLRENLLPYRCLDCGNPGNHNGKPLVLQLDHINGVRNDNRLENIRFLCPNCHTQTPTWGSKRRSPRSGTLKSGKIKKTNVTHPKARRADHDAVRSSYAELRNYCKVGEIFGISNVAVAKIVKKSDI